MRILSYPYLKNANGFTTNHKGEASLFVDNLENLKFKSKITSNYNLSAYIHEQTYGGYFIKYDTNMLFRVLNSAK